jgi:parallel beta-helix repeat protein
VISGNTLRYGLTGESVQVSNNVVYGSGLLSAGMFGFYTISPITVSGSSTISDNTIDGSDETPAIIISSGNSFLFGNIIFGAEVGVIAIGDATIEGNLFFDNGRGIEIRKSDLVIRNNTFSRNDRGILSDELGGSAVIELNLFENNTMSGIDTHSQVRIQNNTFTNNYRAITIVDELSSSDVTIVYNNFESNQNSIYLLRAPSIFDVTNNWWGTTDAEVIGIGIHDSKYDFDLGTVTFAPFLTEPNPEATPLENPEIPEFPSWALLPLFLVVTLVVVFLRKRIMRRNCKT